MTAAWKPDALIAWMPRACRLLPVNPGCLRVARLGDYPLHLNRFRNVDVLVCNTPGIAEHVKKLGWKRDIQMISNFTFSEGSEAVERARLQTPQDAFVVSTMGRFVPRKGFDVLIRSMTHHTTMYLWIIGDGEEMLNLRSLANDLGVIDRIRFAGWHKDPKPFVAASDVFAAASSHEPLGNTILEAWAQKVPVVSSRSEGPSWFMEDGRNGLMVDIGDTGAFARSFERLQDDNALRAHLVAGGTQTLKSVFSKQAVTDAYMALLGSK